MYDYLPFAVAMCVGATAVIVWALARKVARLEQLVASATDMGCRRHQMWVEEGAQLRLRIEVLRQAVEQRDADAEVRRMLRGTKPQAAKPEGGKP
ncbi:MAG: hypothetical protein EOO40_04975 [Deltaproteobacteria bacterium]|nr:MAG: hypothetical protein EOO40_04975 [Deltaproteobacteria bacterium]